MVTIAEPKSFTRLTTAINIQVFDVGCDLRLDQMLFRSLPLGLPGPTHRLAVRGPEMVEICYYKVILLHASERERMRVVLMLVSTPFKVCVDVRLLRIDIE